MTCPHSSLEKHDVCMWMVATHLSPPWCTWSVCAVHWGVPVVSVLISLHHWEDVVHVSLPYTRSDVLTSTSYGFLFQINHEDICDYGWQGWSHGNNVKLLLRLTAIRNDVLFRQNRTSPHPCSLVWSFVHSKTTLTDLDCFGNRNAGEEALNVILDSQA